MQGQEWGIETSFRLRIMDHLLNRFPSLKCVFYCSAEQSIEYFCVRSREDMYVCVARTGEVGEISARLDRDSTDTNAAADRLAGFHKQKFQNKHCSKPV